MKEFEAAGGNGKNVSPQKSQSNSAATNGSNGSDGISGRDGVHTVSTTPVSSGKVDYFAKKEREKLLRKLKSNVEKSEQRIQDLETQLSEVQAKLQLPEKQTDMSLFEQYDTIKKQLENEMSVWEDASMQYEEAVG